MENNAKIAAVPPIISPVTPSSAGGDFNQGRAAKEAEQAAQYRLIIEEGPTLGTFVYKTLDAKTGEVVRQFPREQILRMSESDSYAAGVLIDTAA